MPSFGSSNHLQVNPNIARGETRQFILQVTQPLVLPEVADANKQASQKIIDDILYRRQDMHMVLHTMRLIDHVSPILKVLDHRFALNSFSTGYKSRTRAQEDDDENSDSEEVSLPFKSISLAQTVSRFFGNTGKS